jgi:hypothetical protein
MIPLVCVDVDGTLVGASGKVLSEVWAAADRARAGGVRLVLCSGRPCFGLTDGYARRLDEGGWHVFQNGASIVRPSTGETMSSALAPETIARLIEQAHQLHRVLELYTDTDYAVESDGPLARQHAALLGVPFKPRPFSSLTGPVVRAQWLLPRGEPGTALTEPCPGLERAPSSSPVNPGTLFVGMTRAGVSKATGIATVAAACGVPLGRVMFVGDAHNDLDALQVVGFPVAMGNAEPAVKAVARHHVGHVDDGGLAEAFALALSL